MVFSTSSSKPHNIPATLHFKMVWQPLRQPRRFRRPCYNCSSCNPSHNRPNLTLTLPIRASKKLNSFTSLFHKKHILFHFQTPQTHIFTQSHLWGGGRTKTITPHLFSLLFPSFHIFVNNWVDGGGTPSTRL